ncbi:MAG: hypothetical protein K0Q72_3785 [Armatimonadetes bacterium]|jgi:hypothetical protein|nr:hypothetical protein [Armatimonadota bacterium]
MSHTTPVKQLVRGVLAALGVAALLTGAMRSGADGVPLHLTNAEALVAGITPANNNYEGTSQVVWPAVGVTPSNKTVCAQFITRLIQKSYGRTDSDFFRCIGSTSPYAKTYHDWFKSSQTCSSKLAHQHVYTVQVPRVSDFAPGDLVAIKNLTVASNSTGHMAMVSDTPLLLWEEAGVRAYTVSVIDSTQSPHDELDTRVTRPDGAVEDTGVGEGTMAVFADSQTDTVLGHCWSTDNGSTEYTQSQKSLVVGRLVMP